MKYASELKNIENGYKGRTTNQRTCHCKKCGSVLEVGAGFPYVGGYNGGGYLCQSCNRMIGYHDGNDTKTGTHKNHGFIISPELECNACADNVARYLQSLGFNKESDCTVFAEFTGKQYEGAKGLSTVLKRLDLEAMQGNFSTSAENVGTHLNISHFDDISVYSEIISDYSKSLRRSLSDYLKDNPVVCERLFGRSLGEWCQPVNNCTSYSTHAVFLNFQHIFEGRSARFEFRVAKYTAGENGKKRYFETIEVCKALTLIILKGCKRIYDNNGRWSSDRKRLEAVKTSQKCAEYCQKAYEKLA